MSELPKLLEEGISDTETNTILKFYPPDYGFGSEVFMFTWHLLASLSLRARFYVSESNNWFILTDGYSNPCPFGGFHCLFDHLGNYRDVSSNITSNNFSCRWDSEKMEWWNFNNGVRSIIPVQQLLFNTLPSHFNDYNQRTICSDIIRYLLHPSTYFKTFIDDEMKRIEFNGKETIGIHIRGGKDMNKGQDGRQIFPISWYMKHALSLQKQFNISTIYLSSDVESIYDTIQIEYPQFKFLTHRVSNRQSNTMKQLYTATSLFLLSYSHYFIGTLSSNFAVLATLLNSDDNNQLIISLDGYYHRSCELLHKGTIYN